MMPITIEQVEDALSRTFVGRPPKDVFILDGVVDVEKGGRKATAIAFMKHGEDYVVFTPLSRLDSIYHEVLHKGLFGFGILGMEPIADIGGKLMARKYQLFPGFRKRNVRYMLCDCMTHEEILQKLKLQPLFSGTPQIRHYRLVEVD